MACNKGSKSCKAALKTKGKKFACGGKTKK